MNLDNLTLDPALLSKPSVSYYVVHIHPQAQAKFPGVIL